MKININDEVLYPEVPRDACNFTWYEMLRSQTATRHGLDEAQYNPSDEVVSNMKVLVGRVLQPLRLYLNRIITVNSGFRSPALNTKIGGSTRSDHLFGRAADIEIFTGTRSENHKIFKAILDLQLDFKQMIWEFGDENEPDWIHIAYQEGGNKKQILKAVRKNGKTSYIDITKKYLG